ncbi:hypothetical protein Lalb_Chr08g0234751 [Lupinus albus]|uniref:Uncharacterized protein n=1 Tax=Lupinus albus TaxID=3870 RepID=A0A6A4Q4K7_LUPAL|nr:hypothetical protein Lalb_Chr08g0234751 [Lupinus albus]
MEEIRTKMLLHGVLHITIMEVDKLYVRDCCKCFPKIYLMMMMMCIFGWFPVNNL